MATYVDIPSMNPKNHSISRDVEIVILDMDGAVTQQERLLERYNPKIIPLQERHAELRYWCPSDVMDSLRAYVADQIDLNKPRIAFYGASNRHHMTYLWISLLNEPVTVLGFGHGLNCFKPIPGSDWASSWIPLVAKLPHVQRRVLLVNTVAPFIDTKLDRRLPRVICHDFRVYGGAQVSLKHLLSTLSTDAVYITIDKRWIQQASSRNSKQGTLAIEEFQAILTLIKQHKRIVGVDICGDGSNFARSPNTLASTEKSTITLTAAIDSIGLQQTSENVNLNILEILLS